jgi:hypothetical protein
VSNLAPHRARADDGGLEDEHAATLPHAPTPCRLELGAEPRECLLKRPRHGPPDEQQID